MAAVGTKANEFIENVQKCTPQERIKLLQSLNEMLVESLRQGEEKVALATAAYDVVSQPSSVYYYLGGFPVFSLFPRGLYLMACLPP